MVVCSVQIISRLSSLSKFQMYRGCTQSGSIIGSVNLFKLFQEISAEVWENAQTYKLQKCNLY